LHTGRRLIAHGTRKLLVKSPVMLIVPAESRSEAFTIAAHTVSQWRWSKTAIAAKEIQVIQVPGHFL